MKELIDIVQDNMANHLQLVEEQLTELLKRKVWWMPKRVWVRINHVHLIRPLTLTDGRLTTTISYDNPLRYVRKSK